MMPEMDGLTLCRKIRQNVNINYLPIILLTARISEEDNLEGLDTGADAYLMKPFSIELLRKTVLNLIRRREQLRNAFSGRQNQEEQISIPEVKPVNVATSVMLCRLSANRVAACFRRKLRMSCCVV